MRTFELCGFSLREKSSGTSCRLALRPNSDYSGFSREKSPNFTSQKLLLSLMLYAIQKYFSRSKIKTGCRNPRPFASLSAMALTTPKSQASLVLNPGKSLQKIAFCKIFEITLS